MNVNLAQQLDHLDFNFKTLLIHLIFPLAVTKTERNRCKLSFKAPEEDKEETVSLAAAANETSVDVLIRNDK